MSKNHHYHYDDGYTPPGTTSGHTDGPKIDDRFMRYVTTKARQTGAGARRNPRGLSPARGSAMVLSDAVGMRGGHESRRRWTRIWVSA